MLLEGILKIRSGIIDRPIARKENSIIERCISPSGQTAITYYEVLKGFKDYSILQCLLETGRTHQIRVHMASIGHPLLGDLLYNKNDDASLLIKRQALHSFKMEFIHPISKEKIILRAEIPEDMKKLLNISFKESL